MDLNSLPSPLWLLLVLFLSQTAVSEAASTRNLQAKEVTSLQSGIIKRMENIQSYLADVTRLITDLDGELHKALSNCLGLHSELCEAMEVESRLNSRERIASPWGPGKRSATDDPEVKMYRGLYDDLQRKRRMVLDLNDLVKPAHSLIGAEKKRSCNLNLGFDCRTHEVMDFARVLNFLQHPQSPGRKRSVGMKH